MRADWPVHDIAVITLELATAGSVGSGEADYTQDAPLALDANRLPYLPGTSLAGVLRRVMADCLGIDATRLERWLGRAATKNAEGEGLSQVTVHDGCLHNCSNSPVQGLQDPDTIGQDALLLTLRDQPVRRACNRHNHQGVVDHRGLFERTLVPKGCRFSFELRSESANADDAQAIWDAVQRALCHPAFRLGGGTRAGLGRVEVIGLRHGRCDMRLSEQRARRLRWPTYLSELLAASDDLLPGRGRGTAVPATPAAGECPLSQENGARGLYTGHLNLRMQGYWRIGTIAEPNDSVKGAVLAPYKETVVQWTKNSHGLFVATLGAEFVIPGSSVKGVLAHRTVFHARRLAKQWASSIPTCERDQRPVDVIELFGQAKDDQIGQSGRFWLDDVYLPASAATESNELTKLTDVIGYTAIDGLNQGALQRSLRSERLLKPHTLRVPVTLWHEGATCATEGYPALLAAVEQLLTEQLALGSNGAAGHGLAKGSLVWDSVWSLADAASVAGAALPAPAVPPLGVAP